MPKINYSINLKKIDKQKLKTTETGIWLNGTIFINDQVDQYGKIGFITQNPAEGKEGTILGQLREIKPKTETKIAINGDKINIELNDLPF